MTQNNLITIVTMWNKVNELSRENLSQRHEKQQKKSGQNDRKQILNWNFDESDAEIEGIVCCFAQIENIKRQALNKAKL